MRCFVLIVLVVFLNICILSQSTNNNDIPFSKKELKLKAEVALDSAKLYQAKNWQLVKQYARSSFDFAVASGSDSLIVRSSQYLGVVYSILNQLDSSNFFLVNAAKSNENQGNYDHAILLNNAVIMNWLKLGELDSAWNIIDYNNQFLLPQDSIIPSAKIHALIAEAEYFSKLTLYDKCIERLFEAEQLSIELKDSTFLAQIVGGIGYAYGALNRHEDALSYYKSSLSFFDPMETDRALIYMNIGNQFGNINQLDSAEKYFDLSLEIYSRLKSGKANEAKPLLAKVSLLVNTNNVPKASNILLEVDTSTLLNIQKARFYLLKAQITSDNNQAKIYANQAKEYAVLTSDIELQHEVSQFLHDKLKELGLYNKAYEELLLYQQLSDSIFNYDKSISAQKVLVNNAIQKKNKEIAINELAFEKERIEKSRNNWVLFFSLLSVSFVTVFLYMKYRISKSKLLLAKKEKELLEQENEQVKKDLSQVSFEWERSKDFLQKTKNQLKEIKQSEQKEGAINSLLAVTNQYVNAEEQKTAFQDKVKDIQASFFSKLDDIGRLTKTEKKVAALLKLQLSSKEIAEIQHVEEKTIEIYRSRLRKKLSISSEVELPSFFNSI